MAAPPTFVATIPATLDSRTGTPVTVTKHDGLVQRHGRRHSRCSRRGRRTANHFTITGGSLTWTQQVNKSERRLLNCRAANLDRDRVRHDIHHSLRTSRSGTELGVCCPPIQGKRRSRRALGQNNAVRRRSELAITTTTTIAPSSYFARLDRDGRVDPHVAHDQQHHANLRERPRDRLLPRQRRHTGTRSTPAIGRRRRGWLSRRRASPRPTTAPDHRRYRDQGPAGPFSPSYPDWPLRDGNPKLTRLRR
jgi:hypothetical protein